MQTRPRVVIEGAFVAAVFFVLVLHSFSFTPTGMVVAEITSIDQALGDLDGAKDLYNANLVNVPNFVKTVLGSETINLTIKNDDGSDLHLSVVAQGGAITTISTEEVGDYTMDMMTDEETINAIIASDDQVTALRDAIKIGKVTYAPRTVGTAIKTATAEFFFALASMFG